MEKYTNVEWGGANRVQMHLNGLRWIVDNVDFDWIIIISGQDYPIQPLKNLEKFLAKTQIDAILKTVSGVMGISYSRLAIP